MLEIIFFDNLFFSSANEKNRKTSKLCNELLLRQIFFYSPFVLMLAVGSRHLFLTLKYRFTIPLSHCWHYMFMLIQRFECLHFFFNVFCLVNDYRNVLSARCCLFVHFHAQKFVFLLEENILIV